MDISAVQTRYAGWFFRSRLEARWAVFLNALQVPFEYEMEGYKLPSGEWYLPDLWLPQQDAWMEVKACAPTYDEQKKARLLSTLTGKRVYIFSGSPCPPYLREVGDESAWAFFPFDGADMGYWWCECPQCGSVGVEFNGRSDRLPCKHRDQAPCPVSEHGDKGHNHTTERLLAAYVKAREARFERNGQ